MSIIDINSDCYPNRLKTIPQSPSKIHVYGNKDLLNSVGIAVVGSRHNSEYGYRMCKYFAKELIRNGVTIISGLAEGIDTISHKTCLENGGKTIAVLPCGIDNIFPKQNKELVNDIINLGGTIVTEYDKNVEADSKKFLKRNRIVAGLAIGTLVVEAGYNSGTSVTARITKIQEKKVFCIPSSLENKKGIMCNQLIQKGAKLVTCINDILDEFEEINFIKPKKVDLKSVIKKEYIKIYNILNDEPVHINEIAKKLSYSIKDLNYILMMLELDGYITQLPGKKFIRK